MNARELISRLSQYPPETEILVDDPGNGCLLAPVVRELPQTPPLQPAIEFQWPSMAGDFSARDAVANAVIELGER